MVAHHEQNQFNQPQAQNHLQPQPPPYSAAFYQAFWAQQAAQVNVPTPPMLDGSAMADTSTASETGTGAAADTSGSSDSADE